jgi:hypothetical protein
LDGGLPIRYASSFIISGDSIFVGTWYGLYLSTDKGTNWNQIDIGSTNSYIYDLKRIGNNIFVGADVGVFLSPNKGNSWYKINSGLTATQVQSFAVIGDNIFAGTWGGGVFRAKISDLELLDVSNNVYTNKEFYLSPNPANDFIEIHNCGLSNSNDLSSQINIYNILGTLMRTESPNGESNIRINVSNFAPGIYYLKYGNESKMFVKE